MAIAADAGPEEISDGGPAGARPWIDIRRYLASIHVAVPAVLGWSQAGGWVVLEDMGDDLLLDRLQLTVDPEPLLLGAVDLLAGWQRRAADRPDPTCVAFQRRFDEGLWRREVDHIVEWGLPRAASDATRRAVAAQLTAIGGRALATPPVFTHRDFHSRNLMVGAGGRLSVIDFQDALLGPPLYDLVSLLRDSYFELEWPVVARLARWYADQVAWADGDDEAFWEAFDLLTIERKLKDAARFVYLDRVRGNPSFLRYQARAMRYVRAALDRRPAWAGLGEAFFPPLPEIEEAVTSAR